MAMLNNQMVTMVANFIGDIPPMVKSQPQLPQASEKKSMIDPMILTPKITPLNLW